jgi:cytochrome c556
MKKNKQTLLAIVLLAALLFSSWGIMAQETGPEPQNQTHEKMMHKMNMGPDTRISLNLPPMKAQHQLKNMRGHVVAIQSIINYLAQDEFEKASEVASSQLGLTEEMQMMCSSFGNDQFEKLGFDFHTSADEMAEILKTKDKNKSLAALAETMNYCVTCHATFKQ